MSEQNERLEYVVGKEEQDLQKVSSTTQVIRHYKDAMFCMIFNNRKELLSLYNAVNNTKYDNPDELEINTLENAIYMNIRNDVSFVIDSRLPLYEHQSSVNPNIPLRNLFYISDLLSDITKNMNLYGRTAVKIPCPQFIVFYNGVEEQPEKMTYKLSDLYEVKEEYKGLELIVNVLNINDGYNEEIKALCKSLGDYMKYVNKVRSCYNAINNDNPTNVYKGNSYEEKLSVAVETAINYCIENDILAEFLEKNRAEAIKVSIYEYNQELHLQQERDASWNEGKKAGIEEGVKTGIEEGKKAGIEEGIKREIFNSVYEQDYSMERGAGKLNISITEFDEEYQKWQEDRNR